MADLIPDSQAMYREALDAFADQRRQIEEDLKFSDASDPRQWDEAEKNLRESDPGGIRPCLVHDQIGQYVGNVAGQIEQRPPAIHAVPVDSMADKKVAESMDGFFRHIEAASRAQQHYARAATSAARAGVGYLIVRPVVVDKMLNYQEPRISSEPDPMRVVLDPFSVETDGSDAECGWLLTPMSHAAFERNYPGKKKVSFDSQSSMESTDRREQILIVEQWRTVKETRKMVVFTKPDGDEGSMLAEDAAKAAERGERIQVNREFSEKYNCVKWCRMSGADVLDDETIYQASGIGIVPVYGYLSWADGRLRYAGMPRKARAPQQAYNYHISELRAHHDPYLMPLSGLADENIKALWDKARAERRAYLPYQDWDAVNGREIQAPTRDMRAAALLSYHTQGAEAALRDIQAALGMYQANLGAPSNETSGIAIEQRKQQGEASTSNFPANLAASLGQVGRLNMEMVPRLVDTPRQLRILGIDMTPGAQAVDPAQAEAVRELPAGGISINPNVGRYDVRVVVGASFATQRSQTNQALSEVMAKNPALTPAIAPLWAKALDFPEADKLAQVLAAVAPEAVRAILNPQDSEAPGALKAELEQVKQALAEVTKVAEEAQEEADAAHTMMLQKAQESEAREDEVAIKSYDAYTKRLDMIIKAVGPQAAPALAMASLPEDTPPIVRELLAKTIDAAAMQPVPTEAPGGVAGEQGVEMPDDPLAPAFDPAAIEQIATGQQELMQGLGQLAQTMGQLVRLVQAKRIRTPERGPDGLMLRAIDEIDPAALAEMAPEGPMQ